MNDIEDFLRNNKPVVKDDPAFSRETLRRMDAVENLKKEVDCQRDYGRRALRVALLAGLVVGIMAAFAKTSPLMKDSLSDLAPFKVFLVSVLAGVMVVSITLVCERLSRSSAKNFFAAAILLLSNSVWLLGSDPIEKVVAAAARDFSSNYCKDYISVAEYERIVNGTGGCRQAFLSYGLFASFDFRQDNVKNLFYDPNIGSFRVLGSLNTRFNSGNNSGYMNTIARSEEDLLGKGLEIFYKTYNQYQLVPPVARKRAVEVYGPLNPKKIKCFSYSLKRGDVNGECEVAFSSKEGFFPDDTRLCGSGVLFLKDGKITGFRLDSVEDRFSFFVNLEGAPLPQVTDYSYEVRYTFEEGRLYPGKIIQEVKWVAPSGKSRTIYYNAEVNPCADPFANSVRTTTKVTFRDYIRADKAMKEKYLPYFRGVGAAWRVTTVAESVDAVIERMMNNNPNWLTIRMDLEGAGESVYDQNKHQAELYFAYMSDNKPAFLEKYSKNDLRTRELYRELYGGEAE